MHILRRCMHAHTPIEMYLKLQIAKKSKPLASLGRWDLDSRFSLWKTIHSLWHFACEGNRFLFSPHSLFSNPSIWQRWFKGLFNTVRSIFALQSTCCVCTGVCTCKDLYVFMAECVFMHWEAYVCLCFCCCVKYIFLSLRACASASVSLHLDGVRCVCMYIWRHEKNAHWGCNLWLPLFSSSLLMEAVSLYLHYSGDEK